MKRLAPICCSLALLLPASADAACLAPSVGALSEVAKAISVRINELEEQVPPPERKLRPSLILRVSDTLDPSEVASNVPQNLRGYLADRACIDKQRLSRNIVSALQAQAPSLAVVSTLTNQDLETATSRINAIGVGNIDPDTVTRLRAFDQNYLVVVGGRTVVTRSGCGFRTRFLADADVHSLATTEVLQSSEVPATLIPAATDLNEAADSSLRSPQGGALTGVLRIVAHEPICPSNTEVKFDDSNNRYEATWKLNLGCLAPDETREYSPNEGQLNGTGWPERGDVTVTPDDSCGQIEFDDVPIRATLSPSWKPSNPPVPTPAPGFPSYYQLRPCGCWGPFQLNIPFPHTMCASGSAVNLACSAICPTGGPQYGTVCQ